MNQEQFMTRLRSLLSDLGSEVAADILYDYEEHFQIGKEKGKTEEEISRSLGAPEQIASQYRFEFAVKKAEESRRPHNLLMAIFAGVGLGFFNLVFVLGIYIGLLASALAMFFSAAMVFGSGLLLTVCALLPSAPSWLSTPFVMENLWGRIAALLAGVGVTAAGILLLLLTVKLMELMYRGTLAYIKANIRIVKKAAEK
ncbi:MAG: DUF1700 domain-containing protein [Peptostreptococcaceae bacterium]|nr:DUF1700 domain-containing protein [Peptostreptococcaceae bacterium]